MIHFKCFALAFAVMFMGALESASWNVPVDLSSWSSQNPQVALSSTGSNALIVWQRFNGDDFIIQSIRSTDGGDSWGSTTDLSLTGQNAVQPRVSISSDGSKAIVIWKRFNGSNFIIQAIISHDGGATWATPVNLSPSGQNADNHQTMTSSDGLHTIAVYTVNNSIQAITSSDGGTNWSEPLTLASSGQVGAPQLAMSWDGTNAIIIWQSFENANSIVHAISTKNSGATWNEPVTLTLTGQYADRPRIALSSNGLQAIATWENYDSGNSVVQSVFSTDGGTIWTAPMNLSSAEQNSKNPQLAFSADGSKAIVVWWNSSGSNYLIQSIASLDGGMTWNKPSNISSSEQSAIYPSIIVNANGSRAIAAWMKINGRKYCIQSISSDDGLHWGPSVDISVSKNNSENAQVALSSDGSKAIAIWLRYDGQYVVQSSSANSFCP